MIVSHSAAAGKLICLLRELKCISQLEMAQALGMKTASGMSRLENGTTDITVRQLELATKELKVSQSEFWVLVEGLLQLLKEPSQRTGIVPGDAG